MIFSIVLIALAAAIWFGVDVQKIKAIFQSVKISGKQLAALGLALLAIVLMPWDTASDEPTPAPNGPLSLRGMFVGPTASDDAALIGALCHELGDEIEFDSMQQSPYLKTGAAIDELRKSARYARCRGISIGDRQPAARDAIASYFEQAVGVDGGPLTPQSRAAWVAAFREVGRASSDAAQ